MKTSITVDLEAVSKIIADFKSAGHSPLTSEVIKAYMGHFVSNTGVLGHLSWNAQFGKILSENRETFGITDPTEEPVTDELGNVTTSKRWKFAD